MLAHLLTDHPARFARDGAMFVSRLEQRAWRLDEPTVEPLRQLSEIIEEDFMLLQEVDGALQITAAANAYSSSGRLVAAVGRDMEWAHRPVPALTARLGPRIDRVLASVHESTPCERFNWQVTPIATLYFPPDDPHAANAAAMRAVVSILEREPERIGELLHIRVERQTLTRLPQTRAVAFGLHTYSDPLAALVGDATSAAAMLRLLEAYADERWQYTEMDLVRAPLLEYLRSCAAPH